VATFYRDAWTSLRVSGDSFSNLKAVGERILAANDNNPGFVFTPQPKADTNNWMPRIGFNWNPNTRRTGILGLLTVATRP